MRETQRQRVYRWTKAHLSLRPGLTIDEAADLITRVCRDYGVAVPRITRNGRRKHTSAWNRKRQQVEIGGANAIEHVLHEAAHVVQDRLDMLDRPEMNVLTQRVIRADWHGPTFVRLYLDLIARYVGHDYAFAANVLRARHGVRAARMFPLHIIDPLPAAAVREG